MKSRILGKDLQVSAIGFGCMGISHAYGEPMNPNDAVLLLRKAVEEGYTFFDTAECYVGEQSNNEQIVGKALAPFRSKVKIATKFGVRHEGRSLILDSSPKTIRESVEGSLRRLGVERIDLYYQHRIDPKIPAEEVAEVMAELIKEGKIAHWGISEANEEYLRRAHAVCPVTAIQNRYSMMYREYEKLFPVLEELNVGFVAFSPLANGFLTAKYNAAPRNATPSQIALAWLISKKPYIVPIPGTTKTERMQENAAAAELSLTSKEIQKIDTILDDIPMSRVFGGH